MLYWPGRDPGTYTHRTSHYDIVPTFADDPIVCTIDHTDYAVVRPDRILAVYPYGVEVLDTNYRPIADAALDKAVMLEALRLRGRFNR